MTGFKTTLVAAGAAFGLVSSAFAADLPVKAPRPLPPPLYSWTGFYGGVFGGAAETGNSNLNFTADPGAGNTVNVNNGAISSTAYNNLANGGVGQVSNLINPTGLNCLGLVNCNVGGNVTTSITPNTNSGYRTDSMIPTSQTATQLAALGGLEIGARKQFDNNFVVGIVADIMGSRTAARRAIHRRARSTIRTASRRIRRLPAVSMSSFSEPASRPKFSIPRGA